MGRPRKLPAPASEVTPEDAPLEDYQDMIDAESARASLREKLGIESDVESTIHVYQIDPITKIDFKIWQGDADSYNLEALARQHGSGMYRVKVYARNAEGYKPLQFNVIQGWRLSPSEEAQVQIAKLAAANPAPANSAAAQTGELRDMVQSMMAGFQATIAQVLTAQHSAPAINPFEMIEKLGGVMKAMAPAPAPQAPGFMEVLNMVKTFNDVTGAGKPAIEGATASETLMLEAARALMPAIAQGMAKGTSPAPIASQAPALPPPQDDLTEEQGEKIMMMQLKLRAANRAAARGADARDYAETIYDAFDDDDIRGMALNVEWFAALCEILPDCVNHRPWYTAVRDALIDIAIEDGLLVRDSGGTLTIPAGSDTNAVNVPKGDAHGLVAGDTGTV